MNPKIIQKVRLAFEKDPALLCEREKVDETLGNDAHYLSDILNLQKSDLIRLEREGFALKARYATESKRKFHIKNAAGEVVQKGQITGPHRIRWIIFKDVLK